MRELEERRSPPAPYSRRRAIPSKRTRVTIHVYDLLQPGKLSSLLWHIGGGLLHSGVVVGNKEFAYGGHDEKGVSGVYWNHPRVEPPGCTFRAEVHQGWTTLNTQEVDKAVRELSQSYLGTDWNLLTRNCNHFTNALCRRLTDKSAPCWLNRAASIGISIPCMIPKEVLSMPVPDAENPEGALVQEERELGEREHLSDDDSGKAERRPMLRTTQPAKTKTRDRNRDRNVKPTASPERQTSWYDDDDDGDHERLLPQDHRRENHLPDRSRRTKAKGSSKPKTSSRSASDSTTALLDDGSWVGKPWTVADVADTKGRAKLKINDGQGRIVRVSARVPS